MAPVEEGHFQETIVGGEVDKTNRGPHITTSQDTVDDGVWHLTASEQLCTFLYI